MSGCYVRLRREVKLVSEEARSGNDFLLRASRVDGDRIDTAAGPGFQGGVVHHGRLRSGGIAVSPDGQQRLLLAGSCWSGEEDETLLSPSEALDIILSGGFAEGPRFRGSYLLIFVDLLKRQVVAETPVFGLYPIYFASSDSDIVVAPEIRPLMPWSTGEIDLQVLGEMLHFGYALSPRSLAGGIHRLLPHHRLVWTSGALRIQRFALPEFRREQRIDPPRLEEIRDAFEQAIRRGTNGVSPLAVSLSGGLDSRMLAVAAKRLGCDPIGWTVGVPSSLECRMATQFAEMIGIPMEVHEFDGSAFPNWFAQAVRLTEGRCPPGNMHFLDSMLSGKYLRAPYLHGLIGDIVLGGGFDATAEIPQEEIRRACEARVTTIMYWPRDTVSELLPSEVRQHMSSAGRNASAQVFEQIGFRGTYSDYFWFRYHFRLLPFIFPALASQVLPWTDMIVPFVDDRLFALCARSAGADLMDRRAQVRLIRSAYPEVARLPRVKDGALVSVDEENTYDSSIRRLRLRQRARRLICRATAGRVNLPERETYPHYSSWYRKWKRVREFFCDHLVLPGSDAHGLWRRQGAESLLHLLRVGHDVWNVAAQLLLIQILLRDFSAARRPAIFPES